MSNNQLENSLNETLEKFKNKYPRLAISNCDENVAVNIRIPPVLPVFIKNNKQDLNQKLKVCPHISNVRFWDETSNDIEFINSLCEQIFAVDGVEAISISRWANEKYFFHPSFDKKWQPIVDTAMKDIGLSGETDCYFITRQDFFS